MLTYEYSTLCLSWNRTLQQPAGCPGVGWEKADSRSGGYIEGMRMNIKALWREPSTKRGVVMFITGGTVLYQAVFGSGEIDVSGMESRIEKWIGIGMMLAGLLGWLPDATKEKASERDQSDQTPTKIELVGRSESVWQFNPVDFTSDANSARPGFPRYRDPDDDQLKSSAMPPVRSDENGWNG